MLDVRATGIAGSVRTARTSSGWFMSRPGATAVEGRALRAGFVLDRTTADPPPPCLATHPSIARAAPSVPLMHLRKADRRLYVDH